MSSDTSDAIHQFMLILKGLGGPWDLLCLQARVKHDIISNANMSSTGSWNFGNKRTLSCMRVRANSLFVAPPFQHEHFNVHALE